MEFWITVASLMRRKTVLLPALLVATVMGMGAYAGTPPRYVSSTTMVLTTTAFGGSESLDPNQPTDLTNPLLNFTPSLTTTSAILIQAMGTQDVAAKLGATGETRLTVNDGRTNPDLLGLDGPFLYIVGESSSPERAQAVVLGAKSLMEERLRSWQGSLKAPAKTFVSLAVVVPPSAPQPTRSAGTRLGMMAFVFGFITSVAAAYFGHTCRVRRRSRALARRSPALRPAGRHR
jgi:uncharacterized protein involved in exopolysaccharide biosynthesis